MFLGTKQLPHCYSVCFFFFNATPVIFSRLDEFMSPSGEPNNRPCNPHLLVINVRDKIVWEFFRCSQDFCDLLVFSPLKGVPTFRAPVVFWFLARLLFVENCVYAEAISAETLPFQQGCLRVNLGYNYVFRSCVRHHPSGPCH